MRPATAALFGDLDALVRAHRRYPVLGIATTLNAARSGSLRCMRYVHENGARWHPRTTCVAARGHLACLEYAHLNGAPWHAQATENAASGHLSCLRYCHENGAAWGRMTTHNAAMAANVGCLGYAVDHGAPRHRLVIETCVRNVMDNPASDTCMDTLVFAVDARFPFCTGLDVYHLRVLARLYEREPELHALLLTNAVAIKAEEIAVVMAVRRRLHNIRVIQRAWRAWPDLVRERLALQARRRRAVRVIQLAYLTWACRPVQGRSYKRARLSFEETRTG